MPPLPTPFCPSLPAGGLTLLPLLPEHAEAMALWLTDPQVYTYLDDAPLTSVDVLRERYTRWQTRVSPEGDQLWLNWVVRLDSPGGIAPGGVDDGAEIEPPPGPLVGPLIGHMQATVLATGQAWLAWVFAPAHWGRGHARAATRAMLAHLVTAHGVHTGLASVEVANTRSVALLLALGFRESDARGSSPTERLYVGDLAPAGSGAASASGSTNR